jgi:hypothetical protein
MTSMKSGPGAGWHSTRTGRCPSSRKLTALLLGGLVALAAVSASLAAAPAPGSVPEKGTDLMEHAIAAAVKSPPPLDRPQPARLEAFAFGLG